jgi:hypothetical protein
VEGRLAYPLLVQGVEGITNQANTPLPPPLPSERERLVGMGMGTIDTTDPVPLGILPPSLLSVRRILLSSVAEPRPPPQIT